MDVSNTESEVNFAQEARRLHVLVDYVGALTASNATFLLDDRCLWFLFVFVHCLFFRLT